MHISIVIPLLNEEESLGELFAWIKSTLEKTAWTYEVIFVDDGSRDSSWRVIQSLAEKNAEVKGIRFRRNHGKSAALNEGFKAAQGDVVITMDADMQDSPEEIPELYKMIAEQGYDLVSGWKKKRHDPISKTIPSKFFNGVTASVTGIKLHDFNCGLKAYKKEVVQAVEIYGEMHRFIPVMVKKAGVEKIGERVVQHSERKFGTTKFGLERFVNGFLDLLSILFVTRFGKRPMHLFGTVGTISFIVGFGITLWLIAEKQYKIYHHIHVRDVVEQPLFYLALLAVVVGVQLFLAGFLAELVSRSAPDRNHYEIAERAD
ncbi:MAG: glycosyltransferase family 2 protein [Chitinophagales bacterium]|nr:glycosyltransferase family 2 protein [Chitinophagales bacterium]